jgi:hypothetical protein
MSSLNFLSQHGQKPEQPEIFFANVFQRKQIIKKEDFKGTKEKNSTIYG